MAKRILISLAIVLLVVGPSIARAAQKDDSSAPGNFTSKCVTISGTVTSDGRIFTSDSENRIWKVSNPSALENLDGRHVAVRAKVDRVNGVMRVTSVHSVVEQNYTARLDDAAFRR
jgi:hypothetical protein